MGGSRASVTSVTIVEDLPELCFPNRDRWGFDDRNRLRTPDQRHKANIASDCVRRVTYARDDVTKWEDSLVSGTRKDRSGLRIVVQYVHGDCDSPWHLVAYGSGRACQPRRFRSIEDLLKAIRSVVPDFDQSQIAIKSDSLQSYIAWAGDMALNESQLAALGLKNEGGPKS